MAAFQRPSHSPSLRHQNLLNQPRDRPSAINTSFATAQERQYLPQGPCKFRDLTRGVDTHTCGCRHFWLEDGTPEMGDGHTSKRVVGSSGKRPSKAWCFCGHHACYHEWTAEPSPLKKHSSASSHFRPVDGNLEHKYISEGMTDDLHRTALGSQLPRQEQLSDAWPSQQRPQGRTSAPGLGLYLGSQSLQSNSESRAPSIDFAKFVVQNDSMGLPPTRSASRTTSLAMSSQAPTGKPQEGFIRTSNGRIPTSLQNLPSLDVSMPRRQPPAVPEDAARSATEVATPSHRGTPALYEHHSGDTSSLERHFIQTMDAYEADSANMRGYRNSNSSCISPVTPQARRPAPRFLNQRLESASDAAASAGFNSKTSPATTVKDLRSQVSSLKAILSSTAVLRESLSGLGQRVDALESMSFSYVSGEEMNDRLELFEGRLLDVEGKLEEIERNWHSPLNNSEEEHQQSHDSQERLVAAVQGINESASYSSNVGLNPASVDRLIDVEKRLQDLENTTLPSVLNPWEVEVVFLPWGINMKGIWSPYTVASDESMPQEFSIPGASRSASATTSRRSSNQSHDFLGGGEEPINKERAGLFARACAVGHGLAGKVYQRLRSRGFARTITLSENNARHVHSTVYSHFEELLRMNVGSASDESQADGTRPAHLLGLQSAFVPLRKVHKSSRLRLLDLNELATPSLWTAEFLDSSVFMKAPSAGQRRLFITVPSAYWQYNGSTDEGWTWRKIRELPRVSDELPSQVNVSRPARTIALVGEVDALELCWSCDTRLDPPSSLHSSFSSKASFGSQGQPMSPQATNHPSAEASPRSGSAAQSPSLDARDSNSPSRASNIADISPITPTSALVPRCQSQAPRLVRSTSLPADETQNTVSLIASISKRQMTSFDQSVSQVKYSAPKRRRLSTALEKGDEDIPMNNSEDRVNFERVRQGLTPRRSREPTSPQVDDDFLAGMSSEHSAERGTTPQVYATPFSHTHSLSMEQYHHGPAQNASIEDSRDLGLEFGDGNAYTDEKIDMQVDNLFSDDDDDDEDEYEYDDNDASDGSDADNEAWEGVKDVCDKDDEDDEDHYDASSDVMSVNIKQEPDTDVALGFSFSSDSDGNRDYEDDDQNRENDEL